MAEQLIILDRDGVINHDSDAYIKSEDEWQPIDGSLEAIARLNHAGYRVVVATNQSGIARGLYDLDTLTLIHKKMARLLAEKGGQFAGIFFCPHGPDDSCSCRKPKPGLLDQISEDLGVNLTGVPIVGDSLRDLQAGEAVGCEPVLVKTGKGQSTLAAGRVGAHVAIYPDLAAFVDDLLDKQS